MLFLKMVAAFSIYYLTVAWIVIVLLTFRYFSDNHIFNSIVNIFLLFYHNSYYTQINMVDLHPLQANWIISIT